MNEEPDGNTPVMVHLDHPCYGIDVVRDAEPDHVEDLEHQGYRRLSDLQEMFEIVELWQEWWNRYGSQWYANLQHPHSQKPPMLKAGSPHYKKWLS